MTRRPGEKSRPRGKSIAHYEASKKALAAAELSFKTGMHATAAAKSLGTSRSAVTVARLVLEFGTDQDREDAYSGKTGLRSLADGIRKNLSAEAREKLRKRTGGKLGEAHLNNLKTERELWAKLGRYHTHDRCTSSGRRRRDWFRW